MPNTLLTDDLRTLGVTPQPTQIANHCQTPDTYTAGSSSAMHRTFHRMLAAGSVTRFKVGYSFFAVTNVGGSFTETDGGSFTFRPGGFNVNGGTWKQVTVGGSKQVTVPGMGHVETDWCYPDAPLAQGDVIGLDHWQSGPGRVYCAKSNQAGIAGRIYTSGPDMCATGGAGTGDFTLGQAFTATTTTAIHLPSYIIAETTSGSVIIAGDSRNNVAHDTYDTTGDVGNVERSLGAANIPYLNVATSGDRTDWFNGSHRLRAGLARFATMAIVDYGTNDVLQSATTALVQSRTDEMVTYLPGLPVWITTIEPAGGTSTDAWVTEANQTAAGSSTVRVTENTRRKAGIAGAAGVIDIAAFFESAATPGVWKAPAGVAWTDDGTHAIRVAEQALVAAGTVMAAIGTVPSPARRDLAPFDPRIDTRPITAAKTLTYADSCAGNLKAFSNEGATGTVVVTLPAVYERGIEYEFVVAAAFTFQINAPSGRTIILDGVATATGGNVASSTIGSTIRIRMTNPSVCHNVSKSGTWTGT